MAFALVALNAMRVGLLTRFQGVLGMIVGATLILPLDQFGLIRSAWLVLVGLLILSIWPRQRPPAWETAEAVPWPSQQQIREEREAARREREGDAASERRGDAEPRAADARAPAPASRGLAAPVVAEAQAQAALLKRRGPTRCVASTRGARRAAPCDP